MLIGIAIFTRFMSSKFVYTIMIIIVWSWLNNTKIDDKEENILAKKHDAWTYSTTTVRVCFLIILLVYSKGSLSLLLLLLLCICCCFISRIFWTPASVFYISVSLFFKSTICLRFSMWFVTTTNIMFYNFFVSKVY